MQNWLFAFIRSAGAFGVGTLMFGENVVVFIPSELIMPLAGFYAAVGKLNLWTAVVAGTVGAHLGSLLWYWFGRHFGEERVSGFIRRHGIWFGLQNRDVDKADRWFRRHGAFAVLTGRLIPAIRTFISIPAGLSRMPLVKFIPLSLGGTFAFNLALAEAGKLLGTHFRRVEQWIRPITYVVVGGLFLWWVYRVIRMKFLSGRS